MRYTGRGSCTYWLLILHLFDAEVLQWNDSSGLFVLHKHNKTKKEVCDSEPAAEQGAVFFLTDLSFTHGRVLKVVQTVVSENEPPPLPGLDSSPCDAKKTKTTKNKNERHSEKEMREIKRRDEQQTGRQMYGQTDRWWLLYPQHRGITQTCTTTSNKQFYPLGVFFFSLIFTLLLLRNSQ